MQQTRIDGIFHAEVNMSRFRFCNFEFNSNSIEYLISNLNSIHKNIKLLELVLKKLENIVV